MNPTPFSKLPIGLRFVARDQVLVKLTPCPWWPKHNAALCDSGLLIIIPTNEPTFTAPEFHSMYNARTRFTVSQRIKSGSHLGKHNNNRSKGILSPRWQSFADECNFLKSGSKFFACFARQTIARQQIHNTTKRLKAQKAIPQDIFCKTVGDKTFVFRGWV